MKFLRSIPWYLVGGLVLGIALGLVYTWRISPVKYVDGAPDALHPRFKEQFRSTIASAYQVDGELASASERLAALGDADPSTALRDQASRQLSAGDPAGSAYALLTLAEALTKGVIALPSSTATGTHDAGTPTLTLTPDVLVSDTPDPLAETPALSDTPGMQTPETGTPETSIPSAQTPSTQTPRLSPTPRPTHTPTPTPGLPFRLVKIETICDVTNLEPRILIQVRNAFWVPLPGVDLIISWSGGREHVFTGLKPELGDGYADFVLSPSVVYTVQVASGSEIAENLTAPACLSGDATWWGSILLQFDQP